MIIVRITSLEDGLKICQKGIIKVLEVRILPKGIT